jgi:hypothetical protein
MQFYTVHEPPEPPVDRIDRAGSLVFVADRFTPLAVVLGPFWLLANRLWHAFGVYLLALAAVVLVVVATGLSWRWISLMISAFNLFVAFEAASLRRWAMENRGWRTLGTVSGRTLDECERRDAVFILGRHDEAVVPVLVDPAEEPPLDHSEVHDPADLVEHGATVPRSDLDIHLVVVAMEECTLPLVAEEPMPRAERQLPHDRKLRRAGGGHGKGVLLWGRQAETAAPVAGSIRIGWMSNFGFCPRNRQGLLWNTSMASCSECPRRRNSRMHSWSVNGSLGPQSADEFTRIRSVPYFSSMSTARLGEHFVIG